MFFGKCYVGTKLMVPFQCQKGYQKNSTNALIFNFCKTNTYLFKVNERNSRERGKVCSQFAIKTTERRLRLVNFEHIFDFEHVLVFWIWKLSKAVNKTRLYKSDTEAKFYKTRTWKISSNLTLHIVRMSIKSLKTVFWPL